jgi:hypothetical protein
VRDRAREILSVALSGIVAAGSRRGLARAVRANASPASCRRKRCARAESSPKYRDDLVSDAPGIRRQRGTRALCAWSTTNHRRLDLGRTQAEHAPSAGAPSCGSSPLTGYENLHEGSTARPVIWFCRSRSQRFLQLQPVSSWTDRPRLGDPRQRPADGFQSRADAGCRAGGPADQRPRAGAEGSPRCRKRRKPLVLRLALWPRHVATIARPTSRSRRPKPVQL